MTTQYDSGRGSSGGFFLFVFALLLGAAGLVLFLHHPWTGLPGRLATLIAGRTSPVFPDVLAGDKILLVVHGQSIAGIDLSKLKPEDVRIDGPNQRAIHVNLPPSEVFVTTIDSDHSHVYSRTTGLLVPVDQNLESETRAKAQQQLQAAALSDGILDAARKNARASVTALLYGLGFQQVEVN